MSKYIYVIFMLAIIIMSAVMYLLNHTISKLEYEKDMLSTKLIVKEDNQKVHKLEKEQQLKFEIEKAKVDNNETILDNTIGIHRIDLSKL